MGYISIPRAAACDGYFLEWFQHEHPEKKGLPDHSLFFFAAMTAIFCLVELELVIEGMLTMRILVQFAVSPLQHVPNVSFTPERQAQSLAVIRLQPAALFPYESGPEIAAREAIPQI